jgi:adenylate cyclase, class 2
MAHNNTEIEVKFPLRNVEQVINFLKNNAEKKSEKTVQIDTYFTPSHKNFLDPDYPFQWLRIRESDRGVVLNYKHFYPENEKNVDYCDEFEVIISSPIVKKILERLDCKKLIEVKKERRSWMYKDVEISVDKIEELGAFVELEITTHFDDPKQAKEYLYRLVKEIGAEVGEEDYRGYPYILLEKRGYKFN